jgi:hypothetical protein
MIDCVEKNVNFPKLFVLDAIENLAKVWAVRVKSETIFNCFKKGGFHVQNDDVPMINVEGIVDERLLVSKTTVNPANWSKIRYALGLEIEYEEYLDVDRDLSICGNLTDAKIIEIVQQDRENSEIEDNYGIPNEEKL